MEHKYVKILMKLAIKASSNDEAPIAALITYKGKIIAKSYNQRNLKNCTISHAEIEVIKIANKKLNDWRLNKCTMYVTMKPCEMCEKVIKEARIEKVYYLIERSLLKKQYNKTVFIKMAEIEQKEIVTEYKEILSRFWKNKR